MLLQFRWSPTRQALQIFRTLTEGQVNEWRPRLFLQSGHRWPFLSLNKEAVSKTLALGYLECRGPGPPFLLEGRNGDLCEGTLEPDRSL